MDKITKLLNILWYGAKIVLHLKDKTEKIDKMNHIEKEFKK